MFTNPTFQLRDTIENKVKEGPQEVSVLKKKALRNRQLTDHFLQLDLLSWMTRTALELIGQSGMGYSFDPLTEDEPDHPYSVSAKMFTWVYQYRLPLYLTPVSNFFMTTSPATDKLAVTRFLVLPIVRNWGTPRLRRFVVDFLSLFWGNLRRVRDIVDIMDETSVSIYQAKKAALEKGSDELGDDIISILSTC